jgi:hypothetical protein
MWKPSNSHQRDTAVCCDSFPGPNYQEIPTETHELCLYSSGQRVQVRFRAGYIQTSWAADQGLARLVHEQISFWQQHMDYLSLTFNVTTRSNASSLDIFAEIWCFRCSHHAEDAKRCKITMLQSARKAGGSTVGSKRRFIIIHAAWVQSTNLVCLQSHALTSVVAGEPAITTPV